MSDSFCFTNANVLIENEFRKMPFSFEGESVVEAAEREIDLTGFHLLPGIIDLHGDGFERHLNPRPSAAFDKILGLQSTERELAANGITTAYLAQAYSWEGGYKSPTYAKDFLKAIEIYKKISQTDLRVQIRYEVLMQEDENALLDLITEFGIKYVVYNNHVPVVQKLWAEFPTRVEGWASQSGRTGDELLRVVNSLEKNIVAAHQKLKTLSQHLPTLNVILGSHDDSSVDERKNYCNLGANICEFPLSLTTAQYAKSVSSPVIMGAPNVVRGGSQSGNVSAVELIMEGLCDALVSDYHYPSLFTSAWKLEDTKVMKFEEAWSLISSGPAKILGLRNKGDLSVGYQADFIVMNLYNRSIEATFCSGKPTFMTGDFAHKILHKAS